ncbi:GCN5-related N-acetyl-transferase [Kordia sp. SMS9]|uniref:GNAT family N-acetyltransferase n=1 Tax=Kordia sp. SMS9 TaxID=2282170 RepID=UPI000E0D41D8|nr:GNAT family N-acetyltransferase [Kordia sp. SMS9]AXG71110.1 GCN5-related N-acetyl-transferase [Kordia sp. SMS9]
MEITRNDYGKKGQFTLRENDQQIGKMTYTWAGESKFIIDHTEVDDNREGNGFGKKMVMEAVKFARENTIKILPLCPFAKRVFEKNKDIQDVEF